MRKSKKSISNVVPLLFETKGARRATGVSNNNQTVNSIPDPEVSGKATLSLELKLLKKMSNFH